MKKTLIGLLVALMAVSSFGGLVATWSAWGILDGPSGVADQGPWIFSDDADTESAVWELVYTTKDTIGDIDFDASTGEYTYAEGDKVLSQRVSSGSSWIQDGTLTFECQQYGIPQESTDGKSSDYVDLATDITSGNLYAAIFQYTSKKEVYYALSPLQKDVNWSNDGKSTGTEVNFDMDGDLKLMKLGTIQTVPEPATMSLLGLGALAMVLRRKLRK